MRIIYLDCRMGAAGDMLMAALLELLPEGERESFIDGLNALGIPGVHAEMKRSAKCGIMGTHVTVTVNGEDEEDLNHEHEHAHGHEHHHEHGCAHDLSLIHIFKSGYEAKVGELKESASAGTRALDNTFTFCEQAFADGDEVLIFVTELTANYYLSLIHI